MNRSRLLFLICLTGVAIGAGVAWQSGTFGNTHGAGCAEADTASGVQDRAAPDASPSTRACAHEVAAARKRGATTSSELARDPMAPLTWSPDLVGALDRARMRGRLVLVYIAQSGKT